VLVDLALVSGSLDDQYVQHYSTVQNAVYSVDYDTSTLWTWQGSLKRFRLRGSGLGIQLRGLALDS